MDKYRFEYIKQHIDGLDYISKHITLKKTGNVYKGLCPFHGEKTPSFTVYPKGYVNNKNIPQPNATFYCFGCGVAGDIVSFKRLKNGYDTNEEACLELEKEYGISTDLDIQMEYIKQQINQIKNNSGNFLKLEEINLTCSSQCRNYLQIVKEYYREKLIAEKEFIEQYYEYIDNELSERSEITAMELINETANMISNRIIMLKNSN